MLAPVAIERPDRIAIGEGVYVAAATCLAVQPGVEGEGLIQIGDGCKIGRFNHLYATRSVRLGRKVLTANGVYIADNLHSYRDPETAIVDQSLVQTNDVEIGDGSWIGHNACILGASLGRNCVVGANAVVTKDVPDHCVVVGAPAKVIRRYDPKRGAWRPTEPDGRFLEH